MVNDGSLGEARGAGCVDVVQAIGETRHFFEDSQVRHRQVPVGLPLLHQGQLSVQVDGASDFGQQA